MVSAALPFLISTTGAPLGIAQLIWSAARSTVPPFAICIDSTVGSRRACTTWSLHVSDPAPVANAATAQTATRRLDAILRGCDKDDSPPAITRFRTAVHAKGLGWESSSAITPVTCGVASEVDQLLFLGLPVGSLFWISNPGAA